jgi:hypothetical protein
MIEDFEKAEVMIYMPLLNEGTAVWRPVQARRIADDRYQILGSIPDDETWAFQPGSVVLCESKIFYDGKEGLVPIANVNLTV